MLEVAVGNVNLCVIAIDNEDDHCVYVGPVFSYYEFTQPATNRLTDAEWQKLIATQKVSSRPGWTDLFQAPAFGR